MEIINKRQFFTKETRVCFSTKKSRWFLKNSKAVCFISSNLCKNRKLEDVNDIRALIKSDDSVLYRTVEDGKEIFFLDLNDKMTTKNKNIDRNSVLSLDNEEALEYFMSSEFYCEFELPEYFKFDEILKSVQDSVGDKAFEECCVSDPSILENTNLQIILNKDGHYGVRPLMLANPFIYYFLCREICDEKNWTLIKDRFDDFSVPYITSCALPVKPSKSKKEKFHKSETIMNWWKKMEQRSLELSLEYRYMFVTDIVNCYGEIRHDVITKALAMKDTKKENNDGAQLSENIVKYVRALCNGHNIGIPQGSEVFHILGEIVLGYTDLLFSEAVEKELGDDIRFEVIRYRDDIRIFCNDRNKLETLSYILQRVFGKVGFRMNTDKTLISDSIITDSIKPAKLDYIYEKPLFVKVRENNEKKRTNVYVHNTLQKHILYILMFARKHPNSGQIRNLLSDLDKRVEKLCYETIIRGERIKIDDLPDEDDNQDSKELDPIWYEATMKMSKPIKHSEEEKEGLREIKEPKKLDKNRKVLIAILTQIAIENITSAHYALRVISRILKNIEEIEGDEDRNEIIDLVYARLRNLPNSNYTQIWLQNITCKHDLENNKSPYNLSLCKLVMGEKVTIWDNSWLKPEIRDEVNVRSIVDRDILGISDTIITFRESRSIYDIDFDDEEEEEDYDL